MTADYTGKIRSKGLNGTGITEALIGKHHRNHGGHLMIVASVKAVATHDDLDTGGGGVDYILDDIEVAPDMTLENGLNPAEYVRELVRSFHYERSLEDQGDLLGDARIEPKVDDVLARGDAHKPHPFLPTDAAADNPTCEVCGLGVDATPHAAYELGARADEPAPAEGAEELTEPDGITDADTVADDVPDQSDELGKKRRGKA